ncbi:MAG: hypothetical protein AAGK00_03495 [Pseudomonadota bacterium]
MLSFQTSSFAPILPWANPYYYYATHWGGYYEDPGWKSYFIGASGKDWFVGDAFSDNMFGNGNNDVLFGNGGDDNLYGGADDDWLNGGIGDDYLFGGSGNDLMIGGLGADDFDGGTGIDTVDYPAAGSAINVNLEIGLGFSGESGGDTFKNVENIIGTYFNDVIVGSDGIGGNTLSGGKGQDIIFGNDGDDTIRPGMGGDGNDRGDQVWGGGGDDTFEWAVPEESSANGPDRVMDFDQDGDDVLMFHLPYEGEATWSATEIEYQGAFGTLVTVIQTPDAPADVYTVFLEGTTANMIGEDDFVFV